MILGLIIIDDVMKKHGQEAMVTSLNDAKHDERSGHYRGMSADTRSKWFGNKQKVLDDCIEALGHNPDFDMFFEGEGKTWEHFHLQYLPKRREWHK